MRRLIILCLFCFIFPLSLLASDWHRWRGPNDNHTNNDRSWSPDALKNGPKILWRTEVGFGHSCIAVLKDRGYTMGENMIVHDEDTTYTESILCLDMKTGSKIWDYTYPTIRRRYPGPGATPWITDDRLYTQTHEGTILSLKTSDGSVVWENDLVAASLTEPTPWGCCSSPILEGDILLVNAGIKGVALNPNTGEILWSGENDRSGHGSPVIFTHNNRRLAALNGENAFHIVDVKTGAIHAKHDWDTDADPVVIGDHILLTGCHMKGKGCGLFKLNGKSLDAVWENNLSAHAFQPPIILDGHAYTFMYQSRTRMPLSCIDLKTGKEKWKEPVCIWGSMIASEGHLIILTGEGELAISKANPDEYHEIARAKIFNLGDPQNQPDGLPHYCWTTPVLVNGKLFVRTTYGKVACIDLTI